MGLQVTQAQEAARVQGATQDHRGFRGFRGYEVILDRKEIRDVKVLREI